MIRKAFAGGWLAVMAHVTCLLAAGAAPDFARWMNVGRAHLKNRHSDTALKAFATALQLEPKSAPALRNLARAHLLANQVADALQSLAGARSLTRDSAATSYWRAGTRRMIRAALPPFR